MYLIKIIQAITSKLYIRGFPRILYLLRPFFKRKKNQYKTPDGLLMELDIDDYFENNILWGYYESKVKQLIKSTLREGETFIDIGANIGFFSILGAKLVGDSGQVFSFEPNPDCVEIINRNKKLNSYENLKIVKKAISNSSKKQDFFISKQHALSTLKEDSALMELERTIEVEITSLDREIKNLEISEDSISLIKIDVEGHELFVFQGMKELLSSTKPKIIFENNPLAMKEYGYSLIDIYRDFLKPHGYKVFFIPSKTHRSLIEVSVNNYVSLEEEITTYKDIPGDIFCYI